MSGEVFSALSLAVMLVLLKFYANYWIFVDVGCHS